MASTTERDPPAAARGEALVPRILVVDDEAEVRAVIVQTLRLDGYDVAEAGDAHAALQHLERERVDVVITDVVMPRLDGLMLVKMAQLRGYRSAYIVMTGFASLESAVEAMKLGAADYLPKPFHLDLLRLVVARTLEKQRLEARAREAERYERLAHTDGLTGLYNYRFFQRLLAIELNRAQRFQRPLSLLMLDIDDFKQANDVHGHQAGDRALRQLASLLKRSSRSYDSAARYGGDEFAMILPETCKQTAAEVAERIRAAIEHTPIAGDRHGAAWHITTSLGVACYPEDALDKADLIRQADRALYHAKSGGRNRVVVSGALHA